MSELVEEKQEKAVPFDRQVSDFKKNDSENADRLAKMYKGKFLYCVDLKTWLKHDGQKWCSASPVELQEPARLAVWQRILDISEAYAAFVKECAQKRVKFPGISKRPIPLFLTISMGLLKIIWLSKILSSWPPVSPL